MALTTCGDCGVIISRSAISCPKCGCQLFPIKTAIVVLVSLIMAILMYVEEEEWSHREYIAKEAADKCDEENPGFRIGDNTCSVEDGEQYMASNMEEIYGFLTLFFIFSLVISSFLLYRSTRYKGDPNIDDYDDEY